MPPDAPESAKRSPLHDGAASPTGHLKDAAARLAEIKDYAFYYASAKVGSYKAVVKSLAIYAALGLLAGVAGLAILATAGVLLIRGVAEGLTVLFNGRVWLADLLTGFLLLACVLGSAYFLLARLLGKSRAATVKKYEDLKRQQMAKYGHDIHERAATTQSH